MVFLRIISITKNIIMKRLNIKIYLFIIRHDILCSLILLLALLVVAYLMFKDHEYQCNLKTFLK